LRTRLISEIWPAPLPGGTPVLVPPKPEPFLVVCLVEEDLEHASWGQPIRQQSGLPLFADLLQRVQQGDRSQWAVESCLGGSAGGERGDLLSCVRLAQAMQQGGYGQGVAEGRVGSGVSSQ
jgi:hypothetical protein